jgi:hypothetical protein
MSLILPTLTNGGAVAGGALTLAYQTSGTDNAGPGVRMPTLNVGDLIIVFGAAAKLDISAPPAAYGTGFTSIGTIATPSWAVGKSSATGRVCLSYRVAQAGDSGTGINGFLNAGISGEERFGILVYRPSVAITTVTVQDVSSQATSGNPSSSTISASASSKVTLALAGLAAWSGVITQTSTMTTFSPTADGSVSNSVLFKGLAQSAESPSDVTVDGDDNGQMNAYLDCYLEVE